MEKTFTLDDFINHLKKSNQQKNNILRPSKGVVDNILNFSKSYHILKSDKDKCVEINLN